MSVIVPVASAPDRDAAVAALDTLRAWATDASESEINTLDPSLARLLKSVDEYPDFNHVYPQDFAVGDNYKTTLPDLQNGPSSLIKGAKQQIQHVGISNFRLPIRFHTRNDSDLTLETSVTGSVSLEADKKGINMSRIMRSFYKYGDATFSFEVMEAALDDYKSRCGFPSR